MTIWLVPTLATGLTISEPVTSVVECQIRGVEAQQTGAGHGVPVRYRE